MLDWWTLTTISFQVTFHRQTSKLRWHMLPLILVSVVLCSRTTGRSRWSTDFWNLPTEFIILKVWGVSWEFAFLTGPQVLLLLLLLLLHESHLIHIQRCCYKGHIFVIFFPLQEVKLQVSLTSVPFRRKEERTIHIIMVMEWTENKFHLI